jgi:hypothetical protein
MSTKPGTTPQADFSSLGSRVRSPGAPDTQTVTYERATVIGARHTSSVLGQRPKRSISSTRDHGVAAVTAAR